MSTVDYVQSWLTQRVELADIKALIQAEETKLVGLPPFAAEKRRASIHTRWARILDPMQPTDEIWEYESPPETWRAMCGRAGYALVREGKVIAEVMTRMN